MKAARQRRSGETTRKVDNRVLPDQAVSNRAPRLYGRPDWSAIMLPHARRYAVRCIVLAGRRQ
jgi:hypothetical protein